MFLMKHFRTTEKGIFAIVHTDVGIQARGLHKVTISCHVTPYTGYITKVLGGRGTWICDENVATCSNYTAKRQYNEVVIHMRVRTHIGHRVPEFTITSEAIDGVSN